MKCGEKAILTIRSDYGYGENGSPPKIPGGATLNFEVELLSFKEKEKQKWEMSPSERVEKAKKLKTEGTSLFMEKRFGEAASLYEEAAKFVFDEGEGEGYDEVDFSSNESSCHHSSSDGWGEKKDEDDDENLDIGAADDEEEDDFNMSGMGEGADMQKAKAEDRPLPMFQLHH